MSDQEQQQVKAPQGMHDELDALYDEVRKLWDGPIGEDFGAIEMSTAGKATAASGFPVGTPLKLTFSAGEFEEDEDTQDDYEDYEEAEDE